MLTSAALVPMMTGPGLALFYGGLVRRKNVLSTMMHSFIMMALVTVIWSLVGYSLVFSEGLPFIGGLKYVFLHGVGKEPNADYAATHSAGHLHDLSADVRGRITPCPDIGRVCGADQVQRDGAFSRRCGL